MCNLSANLIDMLDELEKFDEQTDILYNLYNKELPELSENEKFPQPSENSDNAEESIEGNPQSDSEDTEINTDSKPKKKAISMPKIIVPKSWGKDERKREKALIVFDTEDVEKWEWAKGYLREEGISQDEFVKLLVEMLNVVGGNFNSEFEFEDPTASASTDITTKLLEDIRNIALLTDRELFIDYIDEDVDYYNFDNKLDKAAIWAAYNGIYNAAAYTFADSNPATLQRIVDCINIIVDLITISGFYVEEAIDMLTNIALLRRNYLEVVIKVNAVLNNIIDDVLEQGVDQQSKDFVRDIFVGRSYEKAVEKKDVNILMPIVDIAFKYPDDKALTDRILYNLASAAMLDEFSDQMGIIIGALGTVAYSKLDDLTDVVDTICYIVRSKLNEQNVQLCINTLYMLADRCKGKDAAPEQLEQIKSTMLFCSEKFNDLSLQVEQRIMYIDGVKPAEQADKFLKDLFNAPVDEKGGYSPEEILRKTEILHRVDMLMQANEDCIKKFLDAVHQLDDSKIKAVKLMVNDIFQIFYKIMGYNNDQSDNYQNVSDETKKSLKDVIMPGFIAIFHDQIAIATVEYLAQASTNNIENVPEEMFEYTFNIAVENLKVKGSKVYLPCLRSIYAAADTEDENRRKNIITALMEAMKQAAKDGDAEKIGGLMNVVQVDTKYPKEQIQMMHDVLTCQEVVSLTKEHAADVVLALEIAYRKMMGIYGHMVIDKDEMRPLVANLMFDIFKVYTDPNVNFLQTIVMTCWYTSSEMKQEIQADSNKK